jgi:hypothetical protein
MTLTACRVEQHNLRVGYTLPAMAATLYRADGTVVDLTTAASVAFKMRRQAKDIALKVDRPITIVDAAAGEVEVHWVAGDVDTVARYDGWFVVTFLDGNTLPVPNPGFITVVIGHA